MKPPKDATFEFRREWELTAYHEAGHMVIDRHRGVGVRDATLSFHGSPTGTKWRVTGLVRTSTDVSLKDPARCTDLVLGTFAGPMAEAVWLSRHGGMSAGAAERSAEAVSKSSCDSDLRAVTKYLRASALTYGTARHQAMRLVRAHWAEIHRVGRALAARGFLSGADVLV